jgi:hypothetical protein
MYVGRRHTVTVTSKQLLPYACPFPDCKHEAVALVVGVGQGEGNSPYFLDETGAKERASQKGSHAADENARLTLRLARCPRCKRRDDTALRAVKGKAIAAVVATLVLFPLFGMFIDSLNHSSFGTWIFGVIALFVAVFIWKMQSWKWTTIDHRVAFVK